MGLIKIFSGSEILARALKVKIEDAEVDVLMKDNIQSGRFAGFGIADQAVELFIQEKEYNKVHEIIADFRMSI
jgi:hypothetical protein